MIEIPPVVAFLDPALRSTSLCLVLPRGARHDQPGRGGLAHVLEHLLMSAPVDGGDPLSELVERRGGHANAETGLETMLYYARVLAEDADEAAGKLLRAVLAPELDLDVLEVERRVVLQELAAAAADPVDVVQDDFLAALFPGHPLGRPVGGTPEQVEALTLDQIAAGHRELLAGAAPALAVVGPRLPASLSSPAGAMARPAPAGHPLPPPRSAPLSWPEGFTWLAIGARSAARGAPEAAAWEVLAALFGSSPSSPLYRALRGAGLAYSFQAWHRGYLEAGAWRVLIGVEPHNGDKAVEVVRDTLTSIVHSGPSEQDFAAAVRGCRASALFERESPLEHARALALSQIPGAGPSGEAQLAALDAVTPEEVATAAAVVLEQFVVVTRSAP